MKRALSWLICLLHASALAAQSPASGTYDDLATKIAQGDHSAIYAAGQSDDVRFIPVLLKAVQHHSKSDKPIAADFIAHQTRSLNSETTSGAARLALAKLGVVGEQRVIFCELYSANLDIESYALLIKLPYVGGWFQISSLASVLANTDDHRSFARGDVIYPDPVRSVVSELRRLFPDGPAPKEPEGLLFGGLLTYQDDATNWQVWIESHKEKLMQLKPVGSYSYQDCPAEPELNGTITDNHGKPLYARVDVEWDATAATPNDRGGLSFALFPNQDGTFYQAIPPGPYRACVQEDGYFQECRKIRLQNGRDLVLNFSLTMDNEYNRDALQFLLESKRDATDLNPDAVKRAFRVLSHDPSYARALVGLLDFESGELGTKVDQYPAISTLSAIGKPAIPYLVQTIRENENELLRANAAHALAMIHHHCQQDIAALLEAEASKPDTPSAQQARLRAAAAYVAIAYPPCEVEIIDKQ